MIFVWEPIGIISKARNVCFLAILGKSGAEVKTPVFVDILILRSISYSTTSYFDKEISEMYF